MSFILSKLFVAAYIATMYIDSYKYVRSQFNRYRLTTPTNLLATKSSYDSSVSSSTTNRNNKRIQSKPSYKEFRKKFKNLLRTKINYRTTTSNYIDDVIRPNQNTSKVKITRYSDNMIEYEFDEDYDQENKSYPISSAQKEYLAALSAPQPIPHGKTLFNKLILTD